MFEESPSKLYEQELKKQEEILNSLDKNLAALKAEKEKINPQEYEKLYSQDEQKLIDAYLKVQSEIEKIMKKVEAYYQSETEKIARNIEINEAYYNVMDANERLEKLEKIVPRDSQDQQELEKEKRYIEEIKNKNMEILPEEVKKLFLTKPLSNVDSKEKDKIKGIDDYRKEIEENEKEIKHLKDNIEELVSLKDSIPTQEYERDLAILKRYKNRENGKLLRNRQIVTAYELIENNQERVKYLNSLVARDKQDEREIQEELDFLLAEVEKNKKFIPKPLQQSLMTTDKKVNQTSQEKNGEASLVQNTDTIIPSEGKPEMMNVEMPNSQPMNSWTIETPKLATNINTSPEIQPKESVEEGIRNVQTRLADHLDSLRQLNEETEEDEILNQADTFTTADEVGHSNTSETYSQIISPNDKKSASPLILPDFLLKDQTNVKNNQTSSETEDNISTLQTDKEYSTAPSTNQSEDKSEKEKLDNIFEHFDKIYTKVQEEATIDQAHSQQKTAPTNNNSQSTDRDAQNSNQPPLTPLSFPSQESEEENQTIVDDEKEAVPIQEEVEKDNSSRKFKFWNNHRKRAGFIDPDEVEETIEEENNVENVPEGFLKKQPHKIINLPIVNVRKSKKNQKKRLFIKLGVIAGALVALASMGKSGSSKNNMSDQATTFVIENSADENQNYIGETSQAVEENMNREIIGQDLDEDGNVLITYYANSGTSTETQEELAETNEINLNETLDENISYIENETTEDYNLNEEVVPVELPKDENLEYLDESLEPSINNTVEINETLETNIAGSKESLESTASNDLINMELSEEVNTSNISDTRIGSTIKIDPTAKIYSTTFDAYLDENGKSQYYQANPDRVVIGVSVLNENGLNRIYAYTEDANNKINQLINEGGEIVSILTANKEKYLQDYDGNTPLIADEVKAYAEGWYNITSVQNQKSKGVQR